MTIFLVQWTYESLYNAHRLRIAMTTLRIFPSTRNTPKCVGKRRFHIAQLRGHFGGSRSISEARGDVGLNSSDATRPESTRAREHRKEHSWSGSRPASLRTPCETPSQHGCALP